MSKLVLVVKQPFGNYQVGDRIEDQTKVTEVLNSENELHVLKTTLSEPQAAEDTAA